MPVHGGEFTVPSWPGTFRVRFSYSTYTELDATYSSYAALLAGEPTYEEMAAATGEPTGEPQVLLFFGSNENVEDTILVGSTSALMRGTMVKDDLTGSLVSWCWSAVPHDAMRWEQKPIVCCLDGGTGTDYQADAVSMNPDGFTLNFTIVPAGQRKVHYVAISGMAHCFAKIIGSNYGGTAATVPIGWRPQSGLALAALDDTVQDAAGPNREASIWGHMITVGGKAWVAASEDGSRSMFLNAIDTPFTDQDELEIQRYVSSTSYIGYGAHFTGPFMTPRPVTMTLSGTGGQTVNMNVGQDYQGHFTALDVHSDTGNVTPATAVDASVDVASTVPEVQVAGLMLMAGCLGRESAADAWPSSFTLGFWTPDHSYAVAGNGLDGSFYQSSKYAWIDKLTATGVHAGTVAPKPAPSPGATFTTKLSSLGPGARMVWHMFGAAIVRSAWIPQIYRRIVNV